MKILIGFAVALIVVIGAFMIYDQNETNSREVANEVGDAWDTSTDYAGERMDNLNDDVEFGERESYFDRVDARIAQLENEISEGGNEANREAREELAELKRTLENARQASEEQWDHAMNELSEAYNDAMTAE